jgi:hypothetical protein
MCPKNCKIITREEAILVGRGLYHVLPLLLAEPLLALR